MKTMPRARALSLQRLCLFCGERWEATGRQYMRHLSTCKGRGKVRRTKRRKVRR